MSRDLGDIQSWINRVTTLCALQSCSDFVCEYPRITDIATFCEDCAQVREREGEREAVSGSEGDSAQVVRRRVSEGGDNAQAVRERESEGDSAKAIRGGRVSGGERAQVVRGREGE